MNTPVKFELAKLLKEKGFTRSCAQYYDTRGETHSSNHLLGNVNTFIPFDYNSWIEKINPKYLELFKNKNIECSAPTIAEVVMWCFNKYKYSIEYSMNIPESGEYDGCYVFNGLIKGSEDYKLKIFYTSKDYPTIEKALEDTINHFLVNFC